MSSQRATTDSKGSNEEPVDELAFDAIAALLGERSREVEEACGEAVDRLRRGERPTESDVRRLRQVADGLTHITENYVAEATEAAENRREPAECEGVEEVVENIARTDD